MDYIRVGFSGLLTLTSNTNSYLLFRVCVIQTGLYTLVCKEASQGSLFFFVEVDLAPLRLGENILLLRIFLQPFLLLFRKALYPRPVHLLQ